MSLIVATENLSKRDGGRPVVDGLDLRVPEGAVYGFLGPNGSDKSTTMKMLLSLIRPSSAEVHVMGEPMNRATRRKQLARIGSLIESPPGYGHLTGRENMRIVARLLDLSDQQVDFAVHTVRMQAQIDKKVRNYSLGMKQRLGIAMALARQPKLLILDEPTTMASTPPASRRSGNSCDDWPTTGSRSWSRPTCSARSTRPPPCSASSRAGR